MRTCIVGRGQIGTALGEVFADYSPDFIDPPLGVDETDLDGYDIMHVTFPFSHGFVEAVRGYQERLRPKHTVIHSTVPVGTSRALGATFSQVVGLHPHLAPSIKTFIKPLAGPDASAVANYFRRAGIRVRLYDTQESQELAKLTQTTILAFLVEFIKTHKRVADSLSVSFSESYTLPTQDYRDGYEKLGYPEFTLPLLTPIMTPQGGHCTVPNLELLPEGYEAIVDFIKGSNYVEGQ